MLQVNLSVVDIHVVDPQTNKFVMGVKMKVKQVTLNLITALIMLRSLHHQCSRLEGGLGSKNLQAQLLYLTRQISDDFIRSIAIEPLLSAVLFWHLAFKT